FRILPAAVLVGIALYPGAASAAVLRPAALAYSSVGAPSGSDTSTIVTFAVTTGALSITATTGVNLGSGPPATTISGLAGPITVTDDRAALNAAWTATASSTAWTTGAGTGNETIPASD